MGAENWMRQLFVNGEQAVWPFDHGERIEPLEVALALSMVLRHLVTDGTGAVTYESTPSGGVIMLELIGEPRTDMRSITITVDVETDEEHRDDDVAR
jgi:hypothetical protein